jgi:hypothetical protein
MRAHEFISESRTKGLRGQTRSAPNHEFERAHPGLVTPDGRGDAYVGRYYDFYRISSLAGMPIEELEKEDSISFLGNLPVFSAYTEHDRKKLTAIMKKLGMKPKDFISNGSHEPDYVNHDSPVTAFKGYAR